MSTSQGRFKNVIIDAVSDFVQTARQSDDLSLIILRRLPDSSL